MENKKVIIKLKKQPLQSERQERKNHIKKKGLFALLVIVSLVLGILLGSFISRRPIVIGNSEDAKMLAIEQLLSDNWLYANKYEDLSSELRNKAYYGMSYEPSDPYTTYQSKEENEQFASSINMDFVGVGITYQKIDEMMFIIDVLKGSPAQDAGIKVGDIVLAINGVDLKDKTSDEISKIVLGKENHDVNFTIKRANQKISIDVNRGHVEKTVDSYIYRDIPVLNIMSFGIKTYDECVKALKEYQNEDKLIIDLRDNTGGYQEAVEKIAGLFLKENDILMRVVDKDDKEVIDYVLKEDDFSNFKDIIILINNETASASEVLALALLEQHPNITLVGETSFGKGVMQTTFPLVDGSAIKITTAKWLSSKGKWINEIGIKPNIEVNEHPFFKCPLLNMKEDQAFSFDSVSEYNVLASLGLEYLGYDNLRKDGYYDDGLNEALSSFAKEYEISFDDKLDKALYECIISVCYAKDAYDLSFDKILNEGVDVFVK